MDTYALGQTVGKTIKYGAAVAIAVGIIAACSGKKEESKPVAKVQKPVAAVVELTPEEKKQKEFDAARTARGYVLTQMIRASAFDPDALKINRPEYYSNGVCVSANGKNRFGAYVGFQKYCYIVDAKGEWKYSGPN
jgi:hypothetical protein